MPQACRWEHYCYNTSSPNGHSATATMINSHYILVSKWQLQLLHCVTACRWEHYCYNTSSPNGHSATATMINSHYILVSKWQLQLLHCVTACYMCAQLPRNQLAAATVMLNSHSNTKQLLRVPLVVGGKAA